MKKPKILMVTPYLPYHSQAGGQTRSFYILKSLCKTNDITLICFTRDERGLPELKKYCKKVIVIKRGSTWNLKKILKTGLSPYPFLVTNYKSKEIQSRIIDELSNQSYDLIHVECFYLMPNIPKELSIPVLLVDQTIEYAVYQHYVQSLSGFKLFLKPFFLLDVYKLKFWEIFYWKFTHSVAAVSQIDQKLMSKQSGRSDIHLVPNGVADVYFDQKKNVTKTNFPSILFGISNMKWMQNSEAAKLLINDIWPKIKKRIKKAKLFIVGRYAPEIFKDYISSDLIVCEADDNGLAHDPQYYYQRSWVLLAPIRSGGGSRTKFFEAMASKLPIVTTKQGIEGIDAINGKEVFVCKYRDIAKVATSLLTSPAKLAKVGQKAHTLVKTKYSWEKSADLLNTIYKSLLIEKC